MTTSTKDNKEVRDIDCETVMRQLFDYLDGEVDEQAHGDIVHHLDDCRSCFSRIEFESRLKDRVRRSGRNKAPDSLRDRLETLIQGFCTPDTPGDDR